MPVTRKSTRSRGAAAAAQGKQQTLSFNHRITKPTVKAGKDLLVKQEEAPKTVTETKDVKVEHKIEVEDDVIEVPETESQSEEAYEEKEKKPHAKAKKPAKKAVTKDVKKETKEVFKEKEGEPEPKRSEVELRALELPQSAIDSYWLSIDSARMARAVHKKHTEGLTTGEKVLRYFDVSSHYGVSSFSLLSSPLSTSFRSLSFRKEN